MKYCYQCGRITTGEPLYCNTCGRSYNVKLCPRGHANPRSAEACSRCGNRDLSTPQPRVPIHIQAAAFLLSLLPGCLATVLGLVVVLLVIRQVFTNPQWLSALLFIAIVWGLLAWMWSELPLWFRKLARRLLLRKRKEEHE